MKQLILMRHAKSSWNNQTLEDHERPLNPRGIRGAAIMGEWLKNLNIVPDYAIVSDAMRATQTWSGVAEMLGEDITEKLRPDMYLAGPDAMLSFIQQAPEDAQTLVLVGHQPGMSALVQLLSDGSEPTPRTRAYQQFSTGATAILDVPVDSWGAVSFGKAVFRRFATPKEFADA